MSTHNIPFSNFQDKKENHPNLSQVCNYGNLFHRSQEQGNSHGKQAISVRAIEVLLYLVFHLF